MLERYTYLAYYTCGNQVAGLPKREASAPNFLSEAFAVIFLQSEATSGSVSVREHGQFRDPR